MLFELKNNAQHASGKKFQMAIEKNNAFGKYLSAVSASNVCRPQYKTPAISGSDWGGDMESG